MIEVVKRKPKAKVKAGKAEKPSGVTEKVVHDEAGRRVTLRSVDIESRSFSEDFLYIFKKNVQRARRENKKIAGTSDVISGS